MLWIHIQETSQHSRMSRSGWVDNQMGKKVVGWLSSESRGQILRSVEVLQGSVLGPVQFNIFINNLEEVKDCLLITFAGCSQLAGTCPQVLGQNCHPEALKEVGGKRQWEPSEIQIHWKSKANAKSCTWKGRTFGNSNTSWAVAGWVAALLIGFW